MRHDDEGHLSDSPGQPSSSADLPGLSTAQREVVGSWLPGARLIRDVSWGLIDTTILHVRHGHTDLIVKAFGPANNHLARELRAYRHWLGPLHGSVPTLRHADAGARVLVIEFLPGQLVQGSPGERDPHVYRQAGRLLAALHHQGSRHDAEFLVKARDRALGWLEEPHRIDARTQAELSTVLTDHPTHAETVVPTHGDYTPRNWLEHHARVAIIDFGRAAWRPAYTDLARLAARQFQTDAALEEAFLEGYGSDPRTPETWNHLLITEAIGTAVWAHQVGDAAFEAEGHAMIGRALSRFGA